MFISGRDIKCGVQVLCHMDSFILQHHLMFLHSFSFDQKLVCTRSVNVYVTVNVIKYDLQRMLVNKTFEKFMHVT